MQSIKLTNIREEGVALHFVYWKVRNGIIKQHSQNNGSSNPLMKQKSLTNIMRQKSASNEENADDLLTLRHSFAREDLALRFYDNLRLNNEMPKALLALDTANWHAKIVKQSVASMTAGCSVESMKVEMEKDGMIIADGD